MTNEQLRKIRNAGYKYRDNEVFEKNSDWTRREVAQFSFEAGAKYALANKYDELKEQSHDIVQFLKNYGVYEIFFDNLANQKTQEEIIHYLKNSFGSSYTISEAFSWSSTPEGVDFWWNLSELWKKLF